MSLVMWARGYIDGFGEVLTVVRELAEAGPCTPDDALRKLEEDRAALPVPAADPLTLKQEYDGGFAEGFNSGLKHLREHDATDLRDLLPGMETIWNGMDVPEETPSDPSELFAEPPAARITSPADIVTVVAPLLHGRDRERTVAVACNHLGRVIGCDVLSEGTATRSLLDPREALVAVLRRDGLAFAIAHNHPSGDPTPSTDDMEATTRMAMAATVAGLRFLGHVVIGDTVWQPVPARRSRRKP